MTPGPNYRMSRSAKTVLAHLWNKPNRGAVRRAIIQGELHGNAVVRNKRDKTSPTGN
jgi:hypothetical protein